MGARTTERGETMRGAAGGPGHVPDLGKGAGHDHDHEIAGN